MPAFVIICPAILHVKHEKPSPPRGLDARSDFVTDKCLMHKAVNVSFGLQDRS